MWLQQRIKAVVAIVSAFVAQAVTLYQVNQNMTLKDFVMSLVSSLVVGVVVHQSPANK